ncbi:hypothetical protein QVD99_002417 [Batrachochytrium dendrobatidis]|nr:hypothetical protein O5D80_006645 [Batrachochytrium dendrobatidis]KAK5670637.1 hypothetical protein QVD99_002417 [Batrachochytrium dendrobatidis]
MDVMDGHADMDTKESHGLFQFTGFSDDLFDVEPARQRHFIDRTYVPTDTIDGWFKQTPIEAAQHFNTKHGPTHTLYTIEYHYAQHNYSAALDLCHQWLQSNASSKTLFNPRDVLEIAARCEMRTGRPEKAYELMQQIPESMHDPCVLFLRGRILCATQRFNRSLVCFLDYLNIRGEDYTAWTEISHVCSALARCKVKQVDETLCNNCVGNNEDISDETVSQVFLTAYLSIQKALYYLERSHRIFSRPENPFAMAHWRTEVACIKQKLDELVSMLKQMGQYVDENSYKNAKIDQDKLAEAGLDENVIHRLITKLVETKSAEHDAVNAVSS